MKKFLMLVLSFFLCSQTCFAEERITTLVLKDGTEVSGERLSCSNGVYRIRTDSGIVEVKSNDVVEFSEEVNFSYDDLGLDKEDVDKAVEMLNDRLENYSGNQDESYNSDYQNNNYENETYNSDYQNDSYENETYDTDYQNED